MLEEWIAKQHRLIDLEKGEETAQLQDKMNTLSGKQCQSSGLSLLHLEVDAVRSALFGRCCVSLHKLDKGTMQQCFKVGDEVSLYNPKLASRRRSVFPEGGPFDRPSMPRLRRQRPLLIFFPEGVQHLDLLAPSRAVIRICGWCSWIDK